MLKKSLEKTGIWVIVLESYSKAGMQKQFPLLSAYPTIPSVLVTPHGLYDSFSL